MQATTNSSTPQSKPFPRCMFCTKPGSFMRRDMAGERYHSCGDHSRDMEDTVRDVNDSLGVR